MRVVLVVPSFPKRSEAFIVDKFLGLLALGWDVHVLCTRQLDEDRAAFPALGAAGAEDRIHVSWPSAPRWRAGAELPAALAATAYRSPALLRHYAVAGWRRSGIGVVRHLYLDARLVELAPDLVHFEFGALAVNRLQARELLGCRVIVSFRGYDIEYAGLEDAAYYQEVWSHADAVHVLGEALRRRVLARGCPPNKRCVVIPPAVDGDFFAPASSVAGNVATDPARPLRILGVGRLVWVKGYEYALAAVKRLVQAGVTCSYTIVGDGPFLEALGFARHQLGLEDVVEFVGPCDREQVRDWMHRSDVFLHTAVSEGFCNAVLEAQASGLPVVCSDAGGLPENVLDGETGFVVPRRDPAALAEALARLAADPALRRRMGDAGRARALRHFRLPDQIASFDRLYRRVLGMHGARKNAPSAATSHAVTAG